jgi:hypothetical protein
MILCQYFRWLEGRKTPPKNDRVKRGAEDWTVRIPGERGLRNSKYDDSAGSNMDCFLKALKTTMILKRVYGLSYFVNKRDKLKTSLVNDEGESRHCHLGG